MLTVGRAKIEAECLRRLRRRAEPLRLGLDIVEVHLIEVHPPRGVVPAYRDVANALEEKEQQINEAQAAAASRLLDVAGPRALAELQKVLGMDFESTRRRTRPRSPMRIGNASPKPRQEKDGPRLKFLAGEAADVLLKANANARGPPRIRPRGSQAVSKFAAGVPRAARTDGHGTLLADDRKRPLVPAVDDPRSQSRRPPASAARQSRLGRVPARPTFTDRRRPEEPRDSGQMSDLASRRNIINTYHRSSSERATQNLVRAVRPVHRTETDGDRMQEQHIHAHTFENGLTLLVETMTSVQSAAFSFLVPAGSNYEPLGQNGTTAILSDLITRGAGERDSRELIAALDALGVQGRRVA